MSLADQVLTLPPTDTRPLDYTDRGPGIIAICSILLTIATIFVVLRFWARKISGAGWKLDDWLVLTALMVHHVFMVLAFIITIRGGLGRDFRLVAVQDPWNIVILFKSLLGAEICYGFSSSLVKLSALAFYRRIFPTKIVQWGGIILATMCVMWTIAIQVVNLLQCRPLPAFWFVALQARPETKCLNTTLFFLWNSMANCIIDLATILLPIRDVMRLRTTMSKKIGVAAVFLLGSIAFAASLVRTITTGIMYREGNINFTKQFVIPGVTTIIEIYVAIIGTCLPTLLPVYRQLRYGKSRGPSAASYSSKGYRGSSNNGPVNKSSQISILNPTVNNGSFERLEEVPMADLQHHYKVNVSSQGMVNSSHPQAAGNHPHGIMVRSDVGWSDQS